MSSDQIRYSTDRGIAKITFDRPEKMNAMTPQMLDALFRRVREAAADESVRVIVLTGEGRAFCAGLDLMAIGSGGGDVALPMKDEGPSPQWGDDIGPALERFYSDGWQDFILSRKPVIAAINGPAFGWGFILSLHCDVRFAARSALFNATFARLGVPAEKNAAWLLCRLIGPAKTADLLYTARRFDGEAAGSLGVVNAVLDDDKLDTYVTEYAGQIALNSAPRSLAAIKAQIWTAIDDPYRDAFRASDEEQRTAMTTSDFQEALQSYIKKRAPEFKGR